MSRAKPLAELQRLQAQSLGFVLIRCGQLFNERGMARVNAEAGAPILREAHTRLIPHLQSPDGIRVTELAKRIGITKQAVQQLVADMVELEVVRVEPDPDDARARRVSLTEVGVAAMLHGTGVLLDLEASLTPKLGKGNVRTLHRLLTRLLGELEAGEE